MSNPTPRLVLCEVEDPKIQGFESYSPFCLKVHRALKAAGLSYERRLATRPSDHKALNPLGQVPILLVDDEPVCDSTAILARIETLGGRKLASGSDVGLRAEAWLWEEFADTTLNAYLVAARWADDRNWPGVRDAYFGGAPWFVRALIAPRIRAKVVGSLVARDVWKRGGDACWTRFGVILDQLEWRAPTRGFWLGDSLTVADVAIFAQLHSLRTPLTPTQREALAERAQLSAYVDRVDRATRYMCVAASHSAEAAQPAA